VSDDDLSFKVCKDLGAHDEVLARAANLPIARGAYQATVLMCPGETIELRRGARVVEPSGIPREAMLISSGDRPLLSRAEKTLLTRFRESVISTNVT
jgi:hypothetical protein